MVQTYVHPSAKAVERFLRDKFSMANLVVAIGVAAAGHADAEVRQLIKNLVNPQLRIQIRGRYCQAQRQIRAQKIGLVAVIKGVSGKRSVSFESSVVADLNQFAFNGVDLSMGGQRAKATCRNQTQPPSP